VGVRLDQADRDFLDELAPGASISDALRTALAQLRQLVGPPTSSQDAQERLRPLLRPLLDLLGGQTDEPRSVVGEDVVREVQQVLGTLRYHSLQTDGTLTRVQQRHQVERLAIEGGFALVDALLRHAFPKEAAALDVEAVRHRFRKSKHLTVATIAAVAKDEPPRAGSEP
jgi:hypothetical protein